MPDSQEKWVSINEACKELHLTKTLISRLVMTKEISSKDSLADRRVKLVNIYEIKEKLNL